ncbi:hypothetical protein L6452_36486 [Arctium lappa]|uniref:Uncharacterized protein n=1 Tax=Arctium lappa TaxID=4217 RepID=A0ACB8YDI6_ARCLA|nr:hypothetical protein L6452_36486 [Arctium lappa]
MIEIDYICCCRLAAAGRRLDHRLLLPPVARPPSSTDDQSADRMLTEPDLKSCLPGHFPGQIDISRPTLLKMCDDYDVFSKLI